MKYCSKHGKINIHEQESFYKNETYNVLYTVIFLKIFKSQIVLTHGINILL